MSLDLLLVVSNAPSMRAKQQLLIEAIPSMVLRLVWPNCVDAAGNVFENTGTCPEGTARQFNPYDDLRVGVVTTSLGGHGSGACPRDQEGKDDRALFIPKVRSGVPDPEGTGFLHWKGGTHEELEAFTADLVAHVEAVGTEGCEAPAPMEAWYRALVDPSPPAEVVVGAEGLSEAARSNDGELLLDEELLAQREEFLRPVDIVSIVVVSDQDDCSLMDGGLAYENAGRGHRLLDAETPMARPTDACADDPEDECCMPCTEAAEAPEACDVSACEGELALPPELDRASLRCFDTKRRFGVDLAYPIQRYVDGLTHARIVDDRSGELVDNPLLLGAGRYAGIPRDPGLVFLTGIVGVPWQDVATEQSLSDAWGFELLSSYELTIPNVDVAGTTASQWDVLSEPLDPFLVPSIAPRETGWINPVSSDPIVSSNSTDPFANDINGHEADHSVALPELYPDGGPANDRLQASCMFPLAKPLECETEEPNCLCSDEPSRNTAACSPPGGGPTTSTQYFAQAYPAPRILQTLQALGANSVVAPICPKITSGDRSEPSFGFNQATEPLTWSFPDETRERCFPRELPVDEEGQVSCVVVEAWPKYGLRYEYIDDEVTEEEACAVPGRSETNSTTREYIEGELRDSGRCGGETEIACEDYRLCLIDQLEGEAARRCLTDPDVEESGPPGFCYIDPAQTDDKGNFVAGGGLEGGNPVVANCAASERRLLRFVGEETPRTNTVTFIACQMLDLSSTSVPAVEEASGGRPVVEPEPERGEIPPPPE